MLRHLRAPLLLTILALAVSSAAMASNCLQPVGSPYEKGDQICIKVKNTCNQTVAFNWTMGTYKFGVQGSGPSSTHSESNAVPAGKTIEVCADKPADSGKYCFRFEVKNFDQQKPNDKFVRWLNNIQVAMIGGAGFGDFEVGGSGFLQEDVHLAVTAPPGWFMDLSTTYVAAADFPANVGYTIVGPEGEDAVLTVTAIGMDSGEAVGDASFTVVANADEQPVEPRGAPKSSHTDGGVNEEPIGDPDGGDTPPTPALTFSQAETLGAASGVTVLLAWSETGVFHQIPTASFEVFGESGWETIADQNDRPAGSDFGIASALWDTSDLAAGDYLVRVTMIDERGLRGSAVENIRVVKHPETVASGEWTGEGTFTFDAGGSFDPDGTIVDWRWDLGDGTVAYGPTVTHTFDDPTSSYPVNVTVTDDFGLETTAYCMAYAGEGLFACVERSCGCKKMEIRGAGTTSGIPHPPYVGGGNQNGPQVPGGGSSTMNYKFEVLAELVPNSDPSKCTFKQWAKGSGSFGGNPFHKEHNGTEYPRNGDAYGEDGPQPGFSASDGNANPPTIRWIDGPGFPRVPRGTAASMSAAFFAMVSGPLGTCQCSWEVDMSIAANGNVTQAPTLSNVSCSP